MRLIVLLFLALLTLPALASSTPLEITLTGDGASSLPQTRFSLVVRDDGTPTTVRHSWDIPYTKSVTTRYSSGQTEVVYDTMAEGVDVQVTQIGVGVFKVDVSISDMTAISSFTGPDGSSIDLPQSNVYTWTQIVSLNDTDIQDTRAAGSSIPYDINVRQVPQA